MKRPRDLTLEEAEGWAADYAQSYWKHGQEPESQLAFTILLGTLSRAVVLLEQVERELVR